MTDSAHLENHQLDNLRVLVGCEESQTVCKAFRRRGFDAYSCDLQPTRGNPAWHIQGDVVAAIMSHQWDLIVLHPDCTKMAVSGNRWYGRGMPRHHERVASLAWTVELWKIATSRCKHVAMENPVSVLFNEIGPVQYIQPWQFGHGETKKTGIALHGLPELEPTNIVAGREQRVWKMAPGPNRKRDRSKTFDGIAEAMAEQWGAAILGCAHRSTSRASSGNQASNRSNTSTQAGCASD